MSAIETHSHTAKFYEVKHLKKKKKATIKTIMYIYSLLTSLSEMVVGKKGICLSRNVLLFFLPRWFDSHFFFSAHLPGEVHYLRISILEESTFKHLWEVTVPEQQNKVLVSWIPTSNLSGIESFANHAACFAQHTPDGPEDNTWLIDVLIALLLQICTLICNGVVCWCAQCCSCWRVLLLTSLHIE